MSHSKETKRGRSRYIERDNPAAKRYINTCVLCGQKGYSAALELPDFISEREADPFVLSERKAIYEELTKTLSRLDLDAHGRCAVCAAVQDT